MFIEVMAPIPEAYLRMAHAMEEVKKFLIPVCFQASRTARLAISLIFFFNNLYICIYNFFLLLLLFVGTW